MKKRVISIKKIKPEKVYVVSTSTRTFIANGLLQHNCSSCNYNHENNTLPHTQAILLEYGAEHVDLLNTKWQVSKQKAKSFTRAEKLELIEKLESIVNDK